MIGFASRRAFHLHRQIAAFTPAGRSPVKPLFIPSLHPASSPSNQSTGPSNQSSRSRPSNQSSRRSSPSDRRMAMAAAGAKTALQEMSADGEFKRTESSFRSWIAPGERSPFTPDQGRYHLYISLACPWASRCYAFLLLKGLQHAIGITVVKPKWERTKEGEDHFGWVFPLSEDEEPGALPDPINGARTIRELYEIANINYSGKYTVPVLWDKTNKTIVNNESADITRMLNSSFNHIAKHPEVDLYPEELRAKIDEVNGWVYNAINNGVYRCGFATKQKPYEQAASELFDALDKCESILEGQQYLCGNKLTESDIRLFVTLIRFDEVYTVYFKCNKKMLREYPNLFNYTKDIYQIPGVADTVNMYHIKKHYYCSHPSINPYGIIPVGPNVDFSAPHDRERFKNVV